MNLGSIRNEYKKSSLQLHEFGERPMPMVERWLEEAIECKIAEATAMTISTVNQHNNPQSRIVLAKSITETGISFFTNYNSHKGEEIKYNKNVSLHFFWAELQRQIRISGRAEKINSETSDDYFASRPLASQLSAIASEQSQEIQSRKELEIKFASLEKKYGGKTIPRPENWGGYIVKPVKIEFWQGRENRLHDRFLYELENEVWTIKRLAP